MSGKSALLVTLMLFLVQLNAEEPYVLRDEDHRLINIASLEFHVCLQQDAQQQLGSQEDIRNIAGKAVSNCDEKLAELREQLGAKMAPAAYTGLERHIRNRAIKKLLVQLMYQRSSQSDE